MVPFYKKIGGGKTFHLKSSRMGGGRYLFQKNGGGRYFSKEIGYLMHQIQGLQALKWGEVTYIWTQLWGEGR